MTNRFESIANLALTIMCLVVTYAVVDRLIVPRFFSTAVATGYRTGDQLTGSVRELDLERVDVSAVVVVSSSCAYCTESVAFYRQLVELAREKSPGAFQLVFLGLRDAQDAAAFVTTNDLRPASVKPTPADVRARIPGTPTVLIVDKAGRVRGSWSGKLTAADEAGVLNMLGRAIAAN